jgi:putative Holliday junction resolvase
MYYTEINQFANNLPRHGAILAIDYGIKKLGVAVSDDNKKLAMPLQVLDNPRSHEKLAREIGRVQKSKSAGGLVIGLPFHLDGSDTELGGKIKELANYLGEELGVPVLLQDERLTTKAANQILKSMEMSRYQREQVDDKVSASLILESTLIALERLNN